MDGAAVECRLQRTHGAEFKAQVMQACRHPGVSSASVALSHGLNANLVRRWLRGRDTGGGSAVALEAAQAEPAHKGRCERLVMSEHRQGPRQGPHQEAAPRQGLEAHKCFQQEGLAAGPVGLRHVGRVFGGRPLRIASSC